MVPVGRARQCSSRRRGGGTGGGRAPTCTRCRRGSACRPWRRGHRLAGRGLRPRRRRGAARRRRRRAPSPRITPRSRPAPTSSDHVGELVLDRLEGPDGYAELDGAPWRTPTPCRTSARRADELGRQRRRWPARRTSATAAASAGVLFGCADLEDPAARSRSPDRAQGSLTGAPTPGSARSTTTTDRPVRLGHERLHRIGAPRPAAVGAGERGRCGRFAREDHAGRSSPAAASTGCQGDRREEGSRRRDVPELLAEHAQVAVGPSPRPANSRRCAERVGCRRIVDVRPQDGRRALAASSARAVSRRIS